MYAEDPFDGFLPQAGRASIVRWPAAGPGRRGARAGQRGEHGVRPDARQGDRARAGPRERPPRPGRGPRRDRDPRPDHQHRLPARPGRERRVPRRDHRHRLARPARASRRRRAMLARIFAAWTRAMLVVVTSEATRSAPTAGGSGAESAPIVVELDETLCRRPRGRPGPRPRGRARGARAAGRAAHRRARSSTAVASGRWSTSRPHEVEVVHRGQRFVFERPDVFGDHGRRRRRRDPGPDARHRPRRPRHRGRGRRRGRRARRDGGDEDGADAQGAVRRHRHRGRRRRR